MMLISKIKILKSLFSGKKRKGDPKTMRSYRKNPLNKKFINYFTTLEDGIDRYIKWFKRIK